MANAETKTISWSDTRDILVIVGIFLFFTGWTYVYYFYNYFGLSASLVSINYSDYVVYSYVVLSSYHWLPLFVLLVLIFAYRRWLRKYVSITIALAVLLLPLLYSLAVIVAGADAVALRTERNTMRHISFVFKQGTGILAYDMPNDSATAHIHPLKKDIEILKDTSVANHLYLLGQNQEYFFVLFQVSGKSEIRTLPFGTIYFINKNDLLYSKITLTSN